MKRGSCSLRSLGTHQLGRPEAVTANIISSLTTYIICTPYQQSKHLKSSTSSTITKSTFTLRFRRHVSSRCDRFPQSRDNPTTTQPISTPPISKLTNFTRPSTPQPTGQPPQKLRRSKLTSLSSLSNPNPNPIPLLRLGTLRSQQKQVVIFLA